LRKILDFFNCEEEVLAVRVQELGGADAGAGGSIAGVEVFNFDGSSLGEASSFGFTFLHFFVVYIFAHYYLHFFFFFVTFPQERINCLKMFIISKGNWISSL
jgi:hypothetical protein